MKPESIDNAVIVQSSNVDLGDSFRNFAQEAILRTASKYFGHLNNASVYVNHDGPSFRCTVNIQMGSLKMVSGEFLNKDCYLAFKGALGKVEKQLRRTKRALRDVKATRTDKDRVLREGLNPSSSFA